MKESESSESAAVDGQANDTQGGKGKGVWYSVLLDSPYELSNF